MPEPYQPGERSWPRKFSDALRGLLVAVKDQNSFTVHFFCAAAVIALAAVFRVSQTEWCLLTLCIAIVLAAELLNTGLEAIAKALRHGYDPHLRDALDMGSAAVLAVAVGAVIIGVLIFLPYILRFL